MEFVSSRDLDKKREEQKQHLRNQLKDAEEEYRRKERAKQKRKERGEDTWMAPGLEKRLKLKDDTGKGKDYKDEKREAEKLRKKEKKERKKEKRERKHKDKKHRKKDHASSSDSGCESDQWVEAGSDGDDNKDIEEGKVLKPAAPESKREDWMIRPPPRDFLEDFTSKEPEKEEEKPLMHDRPGMHSRELNPYWKENSTGLPPEMLKKNQSTNENTEDVTSTAPPKLTWRQKAMARLGDGVKGSSADHSISQPASTTSLIGKSQSMQSLRAQMKAPTTGGGINTSWSDDKGSIEMDDKTAPSTSIIDQANQITALNGNEGTASTPSMPSLPPPPTQEDLNKMSAKILKAELMGETDQLAWLKDELDNMRERVRLAANQPADQSNADQSDDKNEEVMFSAPDRLGRVRPLAHAPEVVEGDRKRKRVDDTHSNGQRDRYYANDDKITLENMVETERYGDQHDYDMELLTNMPNMNTDSYDGDIFVGKKVDSQKMMEREKSRAIHSQKKTTRIEETCQFCMDNKDIKKHLIVSVGYATYLCLPARESLTEDHCIIVPMQHVVAMNQLDEDVQSEIKIMKKYLTKMFNSMEQDVVFMETAMNFKRHRHAIIECIPLDRELGEVAPMYYKKEMQDSMSEWATNRKIVKTTGKCPIPAGFPYFHVEFGVDGGFANPIDEEEKYNHYFGKEIVGGMMDVEPRLWMRPPYESFEQQKKKVISFVKKWEPFDWTQTIDSEQM